MAATLQSRRLSFLRGGAEIVFVGLLGGMLNKLRCSILWGFTGIY